MWPFSMWPFSGGKKLDAMVSESWGDQPWIGVEGYFEMVSKKGAPRALAKAIVAAAKKVTAPVMVSLGKQIGVANDRDTGTTVRWNGHLRVVCPTDSDGIQVLRAAFGECSWSVDGLGGAG